LIHRVAARAAAARAADLHEGAAVAQHAAALTRVGVAHGGATHELTRATIGHETAIPRGLVRERGLTADRGAALHAAEAGLLRAAALVVGAGGEGAVQDAAATVADGTAASWLGIVGASLERGAGPCGRARTIDAFFAGDAAGAAGQQATAAVTELTAARAQRFTGVRNAVADAAGHTAVARHAAAAAGLGRRAGTAVDEGAAAVRDRAALAVGTGILRATDDGGWGHIPFIT